MMARNTESGKKASPRLRDPLPWRGRIHATYRNTLYVYSVVFRVFQRKYSIVNVAGVRQPGAAAPEHGDPRGRDDHAQHQDLPHHAQIPQGKGIQNKRYFQSFCQKYLQRVVVWDRLQ